MTTALATRTSRKQAVRKPYHPVVLIRVYDKATGAVLGYLAPSRDNSKYYQVTCDEHGRWHCTCPATCECVHIRAVKEMCELRVKLGRPGCKPPMQPVVTEQDERAQATPAPAPSEQDERAQIKTRIQQIEDDLALGSLIEGGLSEEEVSRLQDEISQLKALLQTTDPLSPSSQAERVSPRIPYGVKIGNTPSAPANDWQRCAPLSSSSGFSFMR
uniref:SWIM-type domain-containing protein n=1 Tax=Thermosporothrix sp. COM3 TaxID=2490863 RepID=A0A455SRA9_9CHLR|nr:hypothetical protein KTC_48510 [Thermosporothrix sp. COM3]BBH90165.1 hypothetical protein KTC_49160 [Thermosporothrix sp. COM3]BBH90230.1 hypothetical protein KTC_49810 [Thermosporothrix sp. COM3]